MFLKEDGSLDIKSINNLPIEEHLKVVASLSDKRLREYGMKQSINESNNYSRSTYTDKPIEEWGVDAIEFLNKLKESCK